MEFIVMCLGILAGLIGLVVAIDSIRMYERKRQELEDKNQELANKNQELAEQLNKPKEPPTITEAVEAICQYCRNQEEEGRCAFNRNESNAVCDCRLLKNIPEDWEDGNHQDGKQKN